MPFLLFLFLFYIKSKISFMMFLVENYKENLSWQVLSILFTVSYSLGSVQEKLNF